MTLRSLAHPEWPYTGTAWEWRDFAVKQALAAYKPIKWPNDHFVDWSDYAAQDKAELT